MWAWAVTATSTGRRATPGGGGTGGKLPPSTDETELSAVGTGLEWVGTPLAASCEFPARVEFDMTSSENLPARNQAGVCIDSIILAMVARKTDKPTLISIRFEAGRRYW